MFHMIKFTLSLSSEEVMQLLQKAHTEIWKLFCKVLTTKHIKDKADDVFQM